MRVVAQRGGDEIADGRPGRQWRLDLADRVLLVAAYWRTNLTMRQIGPLFGVSHSAAHRVIDTFGPLLAPVRRTNSDIGAALTVRSSVAGATEPFTACTRAW
ncbi:Helix-turn-helix of DDE superfamily endonuclease [Kutzneria sp. CA-103260]|nr:Helix-turn-helix of DDE superfamily endonuclease [Kutzneria sp. CA-103260]